MDKPAVRILGRLTLVALLGIACSSLGAMAVAAKRMPGPGDVAPEFLGRGLDGHVVKTSGYLGKVVVLSFWATWCAPCRKELPILGNIEKAGKGEIQVIAVNIESAGVSRAAAKILAPINLLLANDADQRAFGNFGATGIGVAIGVGCG